ncbi:hypothetical protein A6R68_24160, partial [Neotoma lepida]
ESFYSQYEVLNTIGRGTFAKVKLAYHHLTSTQVAVKVLHKKNLWCYPISSEVDIMMMVNHPNIISLLQVIESDKKIYLIMELAEGQHLYQHIQEAGYMEEDEARGIFRQILSAGSPEDAERHNSAVLLLERTHVWAETCRKPMMLCVCALLRGPARRKGENDASNSKNCPGTRWAL